MKKIKIKNLILVLTLIYFIAGIILFSVQRHMIFPGQHATVNVIPPAVNEGHWFRVSTSVGEVDAVLCRPLVQVKSFPVLVFGHGNGEVIDGWIHRFDDFRRMGIGVLLVEYPGYGRSDGSPSERGIREAMVKAYDLLLEIPGVDRKRIVGFGQSLGGGAVCALARDRPLAAMILQSTFTSLRPMAARYLMPSFLLRDLFDNAEVVGNYLGPILLIHGKRDMVVPFKHGVALSKIAKDVEFKVYDCRHNCWTPEKFPIIEDIKVFLKQQKVLL
jgi:pimeloyl-ACP methyl ester carboxylesterase